MSGLQLLDDLKESNAKYVDKFEDGNLPLTPSKGYLIVTCMDSRIFPSRAFGIPLGSAHIIRNAGGSARDALRSIIISQQFLQTKHIIVIKHTGCGMVTFTNDIAYDKVGKAFGEEVGEKLKEDKFDFLPFGNLEQAVKDDVEFLKESEVVKDVEEGGISGWIYEVETGKVKRVC